MLCVTIRAVHFPDNITDLILHLKCYRMVAADNWMNISITGEHINITSSGQTLDVDDHAGLLELLIRGKVGQHLLRVNKVLG